MEIHGLIPKSIFDSDFKNGHIGFCTDDNIPRLYELKSGVIYVPNTGSLRYIPISRRTRLELIMVDNPRKEFIKVLSKFYPNHKTIIADTVKIGKNTVIHPGTVIGGNVIIGDNCTIGGSGFGFEDGEFIPHKGNVIIKSGVHIGNNTCIDRAVIGSTIIGNDVKIDNLVHIAHGVKIGDRSMIVAKAMIAGSVEIGNDVWIAPSAAIKQKVKIGNGSTVGMGAVVLNDVPPGITVIGVPAKELKK